MDYFQRGADIGTPFFMNSKLIFYNFVFLKINQYLTYVSSSRNALFHKTVRQSG